MSFSQQNLNAFIELLKSNLFSEAELAEIQQIIEPLPNDIDALSNAIAAWYQQPQNLRICDAVFDKLDFNAKGQRLPGSEKGTPPPTSKGGKPELLNAIQRSQKRRNNDTSSGQTGES